MMSKRLRIAAVILGALVVIGVIVGAILLRAPRTIQVESGEIVTCTYGEVISDTVKLVDVPADKAGDYRVTKKVVTCDRHLRIEKLYAEAQAAILASDLATARLKLAEVLVVDPVFRRAKTQLDAIDAGEQPIPDAGSGGGTGTGAGAGTGTGGQQPVGPIANLSDRVPDVLPGYTAEPITADVFTLSRQYAPGSDAPTDWLVIVVEQFRDAKDAQVALEVSVGRAYTSDVSTVKIGARSVRFGTDGRRFATVAWYEGGVLIVVEASSKTREPAALKSHLTSLVSAIAK